MSKYRRSLPQSHDAIFITDGGLETTLIYSEEFLIGDPAGASHNSLMPALRV
jgi:hypothetical protein